MPDTLVVNEIFLSLQGESSFAGLPCVFVRLTACNLRCSYCDTAYAFSEGSKMSLPRILSEVDRLAQPFPNQDTSSAKLPIVELTGGEPLIQPNSIPLMKSLCDTGFTVLLETNGAQDISQVDPRVHRIMDLKCPGSGEATHNRWENIPHLCSRDEVKFVIGSVQDYEWAKVKLREHNLPARCNILFSWVEPLTPSQQHPSLRPIPPGHAALSRRELAERILADALPVRLQVQMHKILWPKDARGV